jgi:hypothetical protein
MQTIQTNAGETVLKGFYPEQLNNQLSELVYERYIGLELPKSKLYVIWGADSGLILDYLAKISIKGQRFICIDFPEVIEYIKTTKSPNLINKVTFYTIEDFEFESLYDTHQDYVMRNAIILLKSLVVHEDEGLYQGLFKAKRELFQRFLVDRDDNHNFKKFFDLQLDSACDLVHPLSVIKSELEGDIPGVVLGGGPSLDQVIPWLKENQSKVWIFAASRICKRLLKEGITPDFIGVFDSHPLMFEYSKEMFEFHDRSILITGEHSYPRLIRQWPGLKTYSRRRFPWIRGSEDNFISDGPTVTNALFGIAAYLGVSNFYLAGVDFCFTLDGICHESGSIESKNQQRDSIDTTILNYRDEQVGTNIQLYDARNQFEEQFMRLRKRWPNLQAHNLNDGAAVMEGIDYQSIDNIVLGADKFEVVEAFNDVLQFDADSEKAFQTFLKAEVNAHAKWLSKVSKESKKGVHLTSRLFTEASKQGARVKDIIKLKDKLEKLVGNDYQTMVNYANKAFMTTLQPVESESDMSHQEITNSLMGFFNGLNVASQEFLLKLEEIKDEIEYRALEIDRQTAFEELANHWLKARMPGRFNVWLEHYASQSYEYYKTHFTNTVIELEHEFKEMREDERALEQHFKDRLNSPGEFILRLQEAFERRERNTTEDILLQLGFVDKPEYDFVKSYGKGLLLEILGSTDDALIHYLTLDSAKQHAIVQQQIIPLAFSLQQYEKGLAALKSLSQMDSRYLPKYADALALLDRFEAAIEVYSSYPNLHNDSEALISLLRLLVQTGDVESANKLLQQADGSDTIDQLLLQSFVDSLNATGSP